MPALFCRARSRPLLSVLLAALALSAVSPAASASALTAGSAPGGAPVSISAADDGPATVTVPVRVTAATDFGDTVLISGSTAELGAWDPARAVPLATDSGSYPSWSAELHLPPGGQVQYKYLKRSPGGSVTWEDVPDRSVLVSPGGTTALDDRWNTPDGNPLITVFSAKADTIYGQSLYVTGNLAELGAWDPAKAIPLTTSRRVYPQWTGFASLPPNTAVAYKYLKRNPDGSVAWEAGPNHTATTPPTGTFTINDTWQ
ncbi:CBM20 domain-containing protein [Kitasatospora sp. NPDC059571]|uniref:CBM20 domain-containing protein n=1 Tax=Kitasatospora sp. NPDC059571 TaxID=3346871 RepID=UPI0036BE01D2